MFVGSVGQKNDNNSVRCAWKGEKRAEPRNEDQKRLKNMFSFLFRGNAFVKSVFPFLPRAARRVSTADRIADVNTPTRCSGSSRATSFSPTSLVLVSMSSSSSSLPVARSFFFASRSLSNGVSPMTTSMGEDDDDDYYWTIGGGQQKGGGGPFWTNVVVVFFRVVEGS